MRTCPKCLQAKPSEAFSTVASRRDCKECFNAYHRAWCAANKDKVVRHARRKAKKPYAIAVQNRSKAKAKAWRKTNPEEAHAEDFRGRLWRTYKLTVDDYAALHVAHSELCAICRQPATESKAGKLAIDHDHVTGEVRGLLCHYCNMGIGNFNDDRKLLTDAIHYLNGELRFSRKGAT